LISTKSYRKHWSLWLSLILLDRATVIIEHIQKYIGVIEEEKQQKIIAEVVELARSILNEFPLLVPSQIISALLDEDAEKPEADKIGDILRDISKMQPRAFFHKILMHSELSAQDFRSQILDIDKQTRDIAEKMPDLRVIVFIDELNTSSILGMVKEVFVDNTLDGNPLSENIFWVGAINPFDKEIIDRVKGITGEIKQFVWNIASFHSIPASRHSCDIFRLLLCLNSPTEAVGLLFVVLRLKHKRLWSVFQECPLARIEWKLAIKLNSFFI